MNLAGAFMILTFSKKKKKNFSLNAQPRTKYRDICEENMRDPNEFRTSDNIVNLKIQKGWKYYDYMMYFYPH